ncbi:DUF3102 domain-containing protein [Alsobacter sp. R-9]
MSVEPENHSVPIGTAELRADEMQPSGALAHDLPGEVESIATAVRGRLNRVRQEIVAIGRDLHRAKDLLKRGQWLPWLNAEFGMTARTAENYMNVAERFGSKFERLSNLRLETAYKLAARSTPDEVINKVLALAASQKGVRDADATELMRQSGRAPSKTRSPAPATAETTTRAKSPVDPMNDWTSQAFDLLRAQMKDKPRLKTLATLLRRADIESLIDKIDSYLAAPP